MTKISILGCGWLGLPLAKALTENGFSVKGSTTSAGKLLTLETAGIAPFLIELEEDVIKGNVTEFLSESQILIIDIPPKLRRVSSENFVQKIQNLIPFIEKSTVAKVIFVTSTAVYADADSIVSEDTIPQPETESGRQLLEVEKMLQNNKNFRTTVLRFGGLIGDDRHPIHFLAGKQNLENPDAPINLIHQRDCIGILEAIVKQKCWNETFNAVSPFHPTRKEYYTTKAIALNLALPQFEEGKTSIGKIIQSNKVETVLKYKFQNTTL